jgi:hypothetical protein
MTSLHQTETTTMSSCSWPVSGVQSCCFGAEWNESVAHIANDAPATVQHMVSRGF